jgi:mono/diheme cytochrome c family protein
MKRRLTALGVTALALAAAGCGGSGGSSPPATTAPTTPPPATTGGGSQGDATAGKQVFADAGCGTCHTLSAAGTQGTIGPNLDDLKPSFDAVVSQVTDGGGGMPAFKDQLTQQQIDDVAAYVVQSTGS